ncbi:MAG: hypothetical protein R3Y09_02130 [Clostridia bacterium]
MKKIISKILVASMAMTIFSTTAFAYTLEVEDQLEISNIVSSDSRVFAIGENDQPIQTYVAEKTVNIIAMGEDMEYFAVRQVGSVNGYWTAVLDVPFSYGGMTSETTVEPYSIVSISEPGLYYVTSQQDGVVTENIIYLNEGKNYGTNAYLADLQDVTVTVDGEQIAMDIYKVDGETYVKIRDIAQALVGTDQEFEVTWNTEFELIHMYSDLNYTSTGSELIITAAEDASLIAYNSAPKLFKENTSSKINGFVINDENFYDLEQIANKLDFNIDINLKKEYITIDTTSEYLPD